MDGIRTNDGEQQGRLLQGIGEVLQSSAQTSHAILQLAALVSETDLVFARLQDETLARQVEPVLATFRRLNSPEAVRHGPITAEQQARGVRLLEALQQLVVYRNRVAHDTWWAFPTTEDADAIEGAVPTTWRKGTTHSTVRSLRTLAVLFSGVAAGCSQLEVDIHALRGRGFPVLEGVSENLLRVERALSGMAGGTLQGWRWEVVPHDYRNPV